MGDVSGDAPRLVVVAGCNGAGKTTYVGLRGDFGEYVRLDPDAFYARFGSWRIVSRTIEMAFASRHNIVLETTFSGRGIVERIRKAKDDGFNVALIDIGTALPAINLKRIAKRVSQGGHDVPREDGLRRWPRSLEICSRTSILQICCWFSITPANAVDSLKWPNVNVMDLPQFFEIHGGLEDCCVS
jgi:predicted ABC-type ATPase